MYVCIDLKSFYASVECCARGLNPFTTNLAVADPERGDTTICLAITPAMKNLGIRNRCRVFEIPGHVKYIKAKPRMKLYMEVSAHIYKIYLRYISPEDIHVYSIDECFINMDPYTDLYNKAPKEIAVMLMDAIYAETGICATAGIGTNLFLAKVALDITAKHASDHIGFLDLQAFREQIWHHRPITDIWNVGPGIAQKLEKYGVVDLYGVTHMRPATLFNEFGVNALYLMDHAQGIEPCTIADIHAYKPQSSSITSGQVLPCAYNYMEGIVVLKEMVDNLVLQLVQSDQLTGRISLSVSYDIASLKHLIESDSLDKVTNIFIDEYGKQPRKRMADTYAHASKKLAHPTSSTHTLMQVFLDLYEQHVNPDLMIRKINATLGNICPQEFEQLTLFDYEEIINTREKELQHAILDVKRKFGKNALLKGVSYTEKATARERNNQVGGHSA